MPRNSCSSYWTGTKCSEIVIITFSEHFVHCYWFLPIVTYMIKVQQRASRIALGQKLRKMSYEEQCILLNWNTLQNRREYLSVVECYKTVFGLNGFEFCRSKNTRAHHPYKIQTKLAKVNSFKYSFFVRIVKDWNSLPNHLFTDKINKFKKGLKRWMKIYWHRSSYFNCIYFHFKYHSYYTI